MTPFLQQVAKHYVEQSQHLEDFCFVFPNRRSGQFFIQYLQQELFAADSIKGIAQQPHLMPCVTSISELVARLTGTVTASDIEMLFALYDAYCGAMGDNAQEFDRFIYWAHLIVSDFNDIDRSLANAAEIYRNLEDLHDLSSNYLSPEVKEKVRRIFGDNLFSAFFDTDADASLWRLLGRKEEKSGKEKADPNAVKQEFLSLWNALGAIYEDYHKALEKKGVTSSGMQLRKAVDAPLGKLHYTRMAFVGFGVLSAAEVRLFERFKAEGNADFWWDNAGIPGMLAVAPHDPGALMIDGYCKRFGAKPIEPLEGEGPKMRVISVPSTVGQAKVAFDEVAAMHDGNPSAVGIDTAIVMPDEGLLVPLLHSVAGVDRLNVTLGYPLRNAEIVSLMHIVSRMHHQASKEKEGWTYYREDVSDILSHPLIKTYFTREAMTMALDLARTNRFRVPAREFSELSFKDLFTPAMDSAGDEREQQRDYLDNLLAFCNVLMQRMNAPVASGEDSDDEKDGPVVSLQHAFLVMYIDVLNQLKRALAECRQRLQNGTVFYLIDRLTASLIVPFTGEPLQGLQIMGLLETRSLDFENVVILSMNERVFPRRHGINSFIPNYIRRANGMSTIEQQEAIVAFNFYRLLNRASQVSFISDGSDQAMGSSEPSRFISQLEKIYGKEMEHVEMNLDVSLASPIDIEVPNPGYASLLEQYLSHRDYTDKWYLSASAIKEYISCPLLFYFHYIKGLDTDNDVSDFMDYSTFGTIIHDSLQDFYYSEASRAQGGTFTSEAIMSFKKDHLEAVVVRNIKKTFLHVPQDQLDSDKQSLHGEALMLLDTIKSYVEFVLDFDLDLIAKEGPFTVLECEVPHNLERMKLGYAEFDFTYKADRIDRLADGTVRIVDYKTGKDKTAFNSLDDLFDPLKEKNSEKGWRSAILQLFLYCYAYLLEHPEVKKVKPMIYKISSMKESGVKYGKGNAARPYEFSMDNDVAKAFIDRMGSIVNDIFTQPFGQTIDGAKACDYCRFIDYCRRKPSSKRY